MTEADTYFAYLLRRSWLGGLYRRFWLYPRLNRELKGRVLDVGCGLGDFLAFRPNTIGVDINERAVDWCRRRGLQAQLIQPDILPFPDASFDGACLDNVLEHLSDPMPLLAEISRVLKPTGTLVVGVPGWRGFQSDPDHKIYYDKAGLLEVMRRAGFVWGKLFAMPLPLPWLDQHLRQYCLYGTFQKDG